MPYYQNKKQVYKGKKKSVRNRGRRLQQFPIGEYGANLPQRAMGNAAAGLLNYGARAAYNYVNQRVANLNRNVNYRNTKRAAATKSKITPVQSIQADMAEPITKKVFLSRAAPLPRKQLKLGFWKRVLRWSRIQTMNSGNPFPGAISLSHTTVNTDQTRSPCFVYCLNESVNSGAVTTGLGFFMDFGNTGSTIFTQVNTLTDAGIVGGTKPIVEGQSPYSYSSSTNPDARYIMNAWYDIRLNCYGATSQPTIFDIQVVSFAHAYLDPLEDPSNTQEANDRHAMYQGLVQKYMTNPIMPVLQHDRKKLIVHAAVKFTLQPTLTIENDATGQNRIVKMFVKDGAIYDYCYHADGFTGAGADDKLSTVQFKTQGGADNDYADFPAAKARKWLIVRAMNTTRSATETSANTPSFDLIVRKGEYCQSR